MWCRRRQIHSMSPHLSVKLRKDIDANVPLEFRNGERLPVLAVVIGREIGCGGVARGHVNGLVNMGRHEHAALQTLQLGSKKGGARDDENVVAPSAMSLTADSMPSHNTSLLQGSCGIMLASEKDSS